MLKASRALCSVTVLLVGMHVAADALAADRYAGRVKGGGAACDEVEFDISLDGARIVGTAVTRAGNTNTSGAVTGSRDGQRIALEFTIVAGARDAGTSAYRFSGDLSADGRTMTIAQPSSRSCNPPRSGTLTRK